MGWFTVAERPANYIAHWDGIQWGPFGGGTGNYVLALTGYNGRLVAGRRLPPVYGRRGHRPQHRIVVRRRARVRSEWA